MSEEDVPPEPPAGPTDLKIPPEVRSYDKTPMFSALNWQRYVRQSLILEIEQETARRGTSSALVCYVGGIQTQVDRDDILGFVELLHNVPANSPIDLLLHTTGGNVDAAEKLIDLVLKKVGDVKCLRIIIPDFAKSAGTLMALGGSKIVMSDCSELGPIDPQVPFFDSNGHPTVHSVPNYLKAFEQAKKAYRDKPDDPVAEHTFDYFDPILVKKFERIALRTRKVAEKLLLLQGLNYSAISDKLMDIDRLPSHGQMINWEMARDIGLEIDYLDMNDALWRKYWSLYCHLRLSIKDAQRIFESRYVSLVM